MTVTDPYAEFARHRARGPVVEEEVEITTDGRHLQWFGVYQWDSVRAALNDDALSARLYHDEMGLDRRYGEVVIGMDPPGHRHYRAVLQPTMSRAVVTGRLRPAITGPIDRLIGGLAKRRSADLLTELCDIMPALVLTRLFGLSDDEASSLRAQALVLARADPIGASSASDALYARMRPVLRRRRLEPLTEDVLSVLTHGEVEGRALDDLEVFSYLRLLAIAGTDTVSRATANLLFALLSHPDQLDAVREDEHLLPGAVEEAIRWECPALSVPRIATSTVQIAGFEIPRGAAVRCCLGAANRDPDRWSDPDRFDIFRGEGPNAGFGLGAHACLGMHLAHVVMAHTVRTTLALLPGVRLDPGQPVPAIAGEHLRAPTHLRVRWS